MRLHPSQHETAEVKSLTASQDSGAGDQAPSLTSLTVGGARWTYGALGVSAVVQLVFTVALSRLLEPGEFGVFAAAMAVVALGQIFSDMGLAPSIIQKTQLTPEELRSALWCGTLIGVILTLVVAAGARPVATLLGTPEAAQVLVALSVVFLLNGIASVPAAYLRRRFDFRSLAIAEMSATSAGYLIVGLLAALAGLGVWSLVLSAVIYPFVRAIFVLRRVDAPMNFRLKAADLRPLLAFGGVLTLAGLVQQTSSAFGVVAMSRLYGPVALGQYNRATALVQPVFTRAVFGLSQVLFPAFSTIKTDRARLRGAQSEAMLLTGAVIAPMAGIGAAVAPEIVQVLLGDGWRLAAEMLPLVLLYVVTSLMTHFSGVVVDAVGAVRVKLLLEIGHIGMLVSGVVWIGFGSPIRLVAVIAGGKLVQLGLYTLLVASLLGDSIGRSSVLLVRICSGSLIVYSVVGISRMALLDWRLTDQSPVLVMFFSGLAGIGATVGCWWRGPYRPCRSIVRLRLGGATSDSRAAAVVNWIGGGNGA